MRRFLAQFESRILCALLVCAAVPGGALAQASGSVQDQASGQASSQTAASSQQQTTAPTSTPAPPAPDAGESGDNDSNNDTLTLFPHSETSRYWISGQANIVLQWHGAFPAKYSGPNSLHPVAENATSKVYTLYLGYELTSTTEVYLDIESAGGHGISNALGLAGVTNLDVVRNTTLSQDPYVARLMLRQIIPLSDDRIEVDRDELHLATSLPARRLEFRVGKFDVADFFDLNTWGSDSHLQFLNWTADNNGAWDYAANTRGYTDGVLLEYDDHWWTVRFAEALMPKVANGIHLDADVARARAQNLEFEARGNLIAHRAGIIRLLSYVNQADMGNYEEADADYLDHVTPAPDIAFTGRQGRHKYGFGLNFEQAINSQVGLFGRLGWSDGRNESFAYTEDDRTLELGGFTMGKVWHRKNDRAGAVFISNGIAAAHQEYLALGGLGFLLGDGGLTYGPEKIFESFYTAHLWRGLFASFDIQHINNPGYNQARGPVTVPGLRFHVDF
ncbi:MAG TPA: carbohydrate porin [Candidatus Acidoferrales bacterium]|jgi:carbohydrate-selective porin OprB|nr:carbohydrate porin [Candidatus Acidoferrales bacterium]